MQLEYNNKCAGIMVSKVNLNVESLLSISLSQGTRFWGANDTILVLH